MRTCTSSAALFSALVAFLGALLAPGALLAVRFCRLSMRVPQNGLQRLQKIFYLNGLEKHPNPRLLRPLRRLPVGIARQHHAGHLAIALAHPLKYFEPGGSAPESNRTAPGQSASWPELLLL